MLQDFTPSVIRAGCKINLYLRVGPRRPDGYHDIDTLFLPLDEPHDTLKIWETPPEMPETRQKGSGPEGGRKADLSSIREPSGLSVVCDTPGIDPANNTLTKAYDLYAAATGFRPRLRLVLTKGIPHGAGLGGGSSDAAALLLWLRRRAGECGYAPLAYAQLNALAARVGADVPFFLLKTPATAGGIGEKLTPAENPAAGMFLVLLCPDASVSTSWAYAALDQVRETGLKNLTTAVCRATPPLAHGVYRGNDFEEVVFPAYPQVFRLYKMLLEKGAVAARLSGSGASLFGLFSDAGTAAAAARKLAAHCSKVYVQALAKA